MRRTVAAPSLLSAVLLIGSLMVPVAPAGAQRFGQWWWEADVGGAGRSYENLFDGVTSSRLDETSLRLDLGFHGYLGHPALGRFELGTDLLISDYENGHALDTDRLGLRGEVEILPRGTYPLRLYYHRQRYDYTGLASEDPFNLLGIPEVSERWGARARARRGLLRGLLMGVDRAGTGFVDPAADDEHHDVAFADWTRTGQRMQHHARLERTARNLGYLDLDIDDLTLELDERGEPAAGWRWEMNGLGIRRDLRYPQGQELSVDTYRVRNRVTREVRERDLVDGQYTTGFARTGEDPATRSHDLTVTYRWRVRNGLELAPFVQYGRQDADGLSVESPQAGLSASWSGQASSVDAVVSGRASYGLLERQLDGRSRDETNLAFSFSGTLGHGDAERLRKELEVEVARDELRFSLQPLVEFPDLALPRRGVGTEDFGRGRLSLSHRAGRQTITAYGEWSRRDASGNPGTPDFALEALTGSFQVSGSWLGLQANVGETSVSQSESPDQTVDFWAATARTRLWRSLSLFASYRADTRHLPGIADLDGERYELGGTWQIGQIFLDARLFESSQMLLGGPGRTTQGFQWMVSRRFAGWLPFATGTQRRGVIR